MRWQKRQRLASSRLETKRSHLRKYSEARDGDNIMISFVCNSCILDKITNLLPA
jgi:hypothetical protein